LNSVAFEIIDPEIKIKYFTQILNKSKHELALRDFEIFILKLRTLDRVLDIQNNYYARKSAFIIMSLIENYFDIFLQIVRGVIDGKIQWKNCIYGLEYYIDYNRNHGFYVIRLGREYQYHDQLAQLLIFLNRTEDFAGLNLMNDNNKKDVKICIEEINIKAQSANIKPAKTI
jgi:hypothetical protein